MAGKSVTIPSTYSLDISSNLNIRIWSLVDGRDYVFIFESMDECCDICIFKLLNHVYFGTSSIVLSLTIIALLYGVLSINLYKTELSSDWINLVACGSNLARRIRGGNLQIWIELSCRLIESFLWLACQMWYWEFAGKKFFKHHSGDRALRNKRLDAFWLEFFKKINCTQSNAAIYCIQVN